MTDLRNGGDSLALLLDKDSLKFLSLFGKTGRIEIFHFEHFDLFDVRNRAQTWL